MNRPYLSCACSKVTTCNVCLRKAGKVKRLTDDIKSKDDFFLAENASDRKNNFLSEEEILPSLNFDDNDIVEEMSEYKTRHTKWRPPQSGDIGKKAVAAGGPRANHKSVFDKKAQKRSHHQKVKGKDEGTRREMRDFKTDSIQNW